MRRSDSQTRPWLALALLAACTGEQPRPLDDGSSIGSLDAGSCGLPLW